MTIKNSLFHYKNFMLRDTSPEYIMNIIIYNKWNLYRRIENISSSKKPIVLFGCSFTEGTGLEDNQTFSFKLGELTGRPIYNRAVGGWGIQHILYQMQNNNFYKIVPKPEYIIYVYFNGHLSRMTAPVCYMCPTCYFVFYKRKKSNNNVSFILKTNNIIYNFIINKFIFWGVIKDKTYNYLYRFKTYKNYTDELFFDYLKIIKKKQEENWKDSKFVIFFYSNPEDKNLLENVRKLGFVTITREDFDINFDSDEMRISKTDPHPSAHFWDIVTPIIIEKLNINLTE